MTLLIKKTHHGWIVCRSGTDKHSHFRTKESAKHLKQLLIKGVKPKSPYYLESARRLLTTEEYNHLREERKQKYINRGGKVG